jgi:hypothetical protein
MIWFIRWVFVAANLNIIALLIWWIFLIDRLSAELWLALLTIGLGSIGIGGIIAIGATESVDELDSGFVWGPSKSLKPPDLESHSSRRIVQGFEAFPAIWAFVAAGLVSMIVSILIEFIR